MTRQKIGADSRTWQGGLLLVVDLVESVARQAGATLFVVIAAREAAGRTTWCTRQHGLLLLALLELNAHLACRKST